MAQAAPQVETPAAAAPAAAAFPAFPSSASLHVGVLAPDVSEVHLYELFQSVGPVASVHLCRDFATRRSLGYAYVNFHRAEDAERALDTMNFSNIRGRQCRISWAQRDPTTRKSGVGNVFIKNLAKGIDDKTLRDTFSVFGNIISCRVMTNANGESRGYGFVQFDTEEMAQNAIKLCNGKMIAGEQVVVMPFKGRRDRQSNDRSTFTNVYCNNIPVGTTKEKLTELFTPFGAVTSCLVSNAPDSKNRGTTYAFINFAEPAQATAAINGLNGQDPLNSGKKLLVTQAQSRETRERQLKELFEQRRLERAKKYQGINVYTKNLPETMDDNGLRELFSKFGNISSAKVMMNPQTGKSRGFGFVCFTTPEEATKAVSGMNQQMVEGKPLYVSLAQRKDVRRAALEMQFAQQQKIPGMGPQPMYPPLYYTPQAMPAQRMMYPPQMVPPRRGWAQQSRVPQPMVGQQYYVNMPMNGPRPAAARGRGQRPVKPGAFQQIPPQQGNGRARGAPVNNFKINAGVRNVGPLAGSAPMGAAMAAPAQTLTAQELARADPEMQKRIIGERLFPLVAHVQPERAGKITGMLLDMDTSELLHLLDSPEARQEKINEAVEVLEEAANDGDGQGAAAGANA